VATLPQIRLEQLLGGVWVDMAGTPARLDGETPRSRVLWSDSGGSVQVVRGIGEDGGVASGTLDCVLENNDGALTPKNPAGPFWPNLSRFRRVRMSHLVGGVWRPQFTGFVTAEPVSWGNEVATDCRVAVSATDLVGMMYAPLRSVAVEATCDYGPLAYWPLTDPEAAQAADQSGNGRPGLAVQHYGADGGEISWAGGLVLPTDSAGGLLLTPDGEKGWYLRSGSGVDLPASWSLSVVVSPAAKDGYVCQVGTDSYSIGVWYDTSTKKLSAIETLLDSGGDPVDYVLSTTTGTWAAGGVETLTVTATTVKLGSSGTTGSRHSTHTMLGCLVSAGGALAVESGRARLFSGELKHLALWPGGVPAGAASDVLSGPADMLMLSTAAARIVAWSKVPPMVWRTNHFVNPTAVSTLGFFTEMSGGGAMAGSLISTFPAAITTAFRATCTVAPAAGTLAGIRVGGLGALMVPGGTTYTGAVRVASSVTAQYVLRVAFRNSAGSTIGFTDAAPVTVTAGVVRALVVTGDAPVGTAQALMTVYRLETSTAWAAGQTLDVSIVAFESGTELGLWFYGDYNPSPADYTVGWEGTQYASASTLTVKPVRLSGTDVPIQLVKTEGMSGADLLSQLAQGTMARIHAGAAGGIRVVSWDYAAGSVVAPSGDIDPEVEWVADDAEVSGVTVTWPDGTTYTVGDGSTAVAGVLSQQQGRSVADWMLASATDIPRFPAAVFDLLVMSDVEAAALDAADVGTILSIPGLPGQLPSTTQTGVVEAVTETWGAEEWSLQLTTTPDDRARLFVPGDATAGVVGAGFLAGPAGPDVGGTGALWRAGDPVTAAKLNSSAAPGGVLQTGTVTITPSSANTPTSLAVTFPTAFVSAPSAVVLTPVDDKVGGQVTGWSATSITATGFLAWVCRTNTTATVLQWVAVQ
jgi:hypothetical protein